MAGIMTSRERVFALLRREPADRMGLFDHFWPETLRDYWPKQGFAEGTDPGQHFGYDLMGAGGWLKTTPLLTGDVVVEESDRHRLVRDGFGGTARYWQGRSGTPEHVGFDCVTRERWEETYKQPLMKLDPERVGVEGMRTGIARAREENKFSFFGGMYVFEHMRRMMGDVVMMQAMMEDPEWVQDFCQTYLDFFIAHCTYLFAEGGQPDGAFIYEDLGFNKGLFCSPRTLRDLLFPYYEGLFGFFHERGMPVILHSCGNMTAAVPMMIEAGIDCLQPMEAKSGMDVVALAKAHGDRIAFMGNIDVQVWERGNEAEIEAEVGGKMEALKALGAAYFMHSDHSITPQVTYASYQHALRVFHAHAAY